MSQERPRGPYCTAPWVEAHLYNDGQTRPCDHNQFSLGNWQQEGIEAVWRGERYREFRRKILAGEFPDEQCRSCYLIQTTSNLGNHVWRHFQPAAKKVETELGGEIPEIRALGELFKSPQPPQDWRARMDAFFSASVKLRAALPHLETEFQHLEQMAEIAGDYLAGELSPKYVAPVRQARLINKCNARCIMCAGKFNGDIVNGPSMDEKHVPGVLEPHGHIVGFCSETSEFLLYPKWREIALKLSEERLPKLRIFTNGMLMNRENARFLIDNRVLETLHFSMNGASREIIETGQINVKFPQLCENIRHVFAYAQEKEVGFQLAFSFIIMRRNHHEIPELLRLIHELRGANTRLKPEIYFAYLESNNDMENYRDFLFREHHSLVDEERLLGKFRDAVALAKEYGFEVTLFESTLEEFLRTEKKPPKLVCKMKDVKLLLDYLEAGGDRAVLGAIRGTTPQVDAILATIRSRPEDIAMLRSELLPRDLLLSQREDSMVQGFAQIEATPANRWRWALGASQRVAFQPFNGTNFIRYKIQLPMADTRLVIRGPEREFVSVTSKMNKEVIEGVFESADAGELELAVSKWNAGESRFTPDERPLAYTVYSFEHCRSLE